jgi:predicted SAM-dependent methyltransferase
MDATSRFPFPDNTFEKIYSEHMIEHLSYENGKKMIAECYRSLKPGGIIRVSTPDFAFLIGLYNNPTLPLHDRYIRWSSETYLHNRVPIKPIFTINNFVRDWGHLFIYDFETLCQTLASHGFVNIRKVEISKSDHTDLSGLENERRMPPGFLALESLIVEADKK